MHFELNYVNGFRIYSVNFHKKYPLRYITLQKYSYYITKPLVGENVELFRSK